MAPIIIPLAVLAAMLAPKVDARGYNEGDWLGIENYVAYSQVRYYSTNNALQLNGIVFGESGNLPFAEWAGRQSCTINGGGYTGTTCIDSAIKEATYAAAEGVRASSSDLYNTVVFRGQGQKSSAYRFADDGQGSSCKNPPTYAIQGNPCPPSSGSVDAVNNINAVYNFNARGIKVTCKAACGNPDGSINKANWENLISQLTKTMFDENWYGARFAVKRLSTDQVLARCRITSPNIVQFGLDTCPDLVPRAGAGFTGDQQPF